MVGFLEDSATLKAVLLGVVEGLTEFIPVSSTGHLILCGKWLSFDERLAKTFDIFIQLGAVLALLLFFRRDLLLWARSMGSGGAGRKVGINLVVAFLPAAVIGFLFDDMIEELLMSPRPVALALIVGAVALHWGEVRFQGGKTSALVDMTPRQALAVGFCQCLALWPGFSRSAATILGGMMVGLTVPAAVEFSFLLSIPTLGAATLYSLLKVAGQLQASDWYLLNVGLWTAFLVSLPVLAGFLRFVQTRSMRPFVLYRLALGLLVLTLL